MAANSIRFFILPNGDCVSDPVMMGNIAISHFQGILAPTSVPITVSTPQWFTALSSFICNEAQKQALSTAPQSDEITVTFKKLNPNKSPGPDGFSSGFFKATWEILGEEVVQTTSKFFSSGFLPATINATILTMVPKTTGASSIRDYRPISCCTTIYKAISKMLVFRLKPILPRLILPNQTAFVKGRLLIENTILATELVRDYHNSKGPPRITLKVDIAKAFDTLNWDFLFICLSAIQVPQLSLNWLRACVCTTNFTIGFNGTVQGYFKGKRGLRQGDPLSPTSS